MVPIAHDRHIIRNRTHGFIILLNKLISAGLRIFFKTDRTAEAHLFCVLLSAQLEGIAFLKPVIRCLDLVAVFNLLFKHPIAVADTASVCRVIQCCQ